HIATAPYRLDVVLAACRLRQLLAQLADEHVDDFQLGLVHAAIEMIEEHLLGQRGALAQAEQFEDAVFLGGQVQRALVDADDAAVEVDQQLAGANRRFGMPFRAADDRLNAGDQLAAVERLGKKVVGAKPEALDLVVELDEAGQDQDGSA